MSMYKELQIKQYGRYKLVIQFTPYKETKFSLVLKGRTSTHYIYTTIDTKKDINVFTNLDNYIICYGNKTNTLIDSYIQGNKRMLHYLIDFCNKYYDKYNNTCWLGGLKYLDDTNDIKIASKKYLLYTKRSILNKVSDFIIQCSEGVDKVPETF